MEYLNHRVGIKRGLKALLVSMMIFAAMIFVIQGLLILIPVGIAAWGIYKAVKFIKSRLLTLKKVNVDKVESIEICEEKFDDMDTSNVIDVEYEQIYK